MRRIDMEQPCTKEMKELLLEISKALQGMDEIALQEVHAFIEEVLLHDAKEKRNIDENGFYC
jgi:hypothetical protein